MGISDSKYTREFLKELQALPLYRKVQFTQNRIIEWYTHFNGNVYISVSGKDSTVLLHIARQIFPDIKAVFNNTGLEYPEVRAHCKALGTCVVTPDKTFADVITKYGYPIVSKEVSEAIYYARKREREQLSTKGASYSHPSAERNSAQTGGPLWRRKCLLGAVGDRSMFNKKKWLPLCLEAPFRISHLCCRFLKKAPLDKYARQNGHLKMITGVTAEESRLRMQAWLRHG